MIDSLAQSKLLILNLSIWLKHKEYGMNMQTKKF